MDTREKLIELIYKNSPRLVEEEAKILANRLIANGVTFAKDNNVGDKLSPTDKDNNVPSKWISVKDRLPKKNGQYLCNYHFGEYPKMTFTQVLDYYATDIVPHFQHTLGDGSMKVTHWMPLPEPPTNEVEQ